MARRPGRVRGGRAIVGGGAGAKETSAKRSGRWPLTVRGEPTRPAPRRAARRAIVVARRAGLELQAHERQQSLDLARRRGERDRARVAAVRVELQGGFELHAGEPLRFQALNETLQGRVAEEEKGLERDERPFEFHALREVGRGQSRLARARGSPPRGGLKR